MSSDEETMPKPDQDIEQRMAKLVKQNQVLKAAYLQVCFLSKSQVNSTQIATGTKNKERTTS